MAFSNRKSKRGKKRSGSGWWASLDKGRRRQMLAAGAKIVLVAVVLGAVGVSISRLEARVDRRLIETVQQPELVFIDLPQRLAALAEADLRDSVSDLMGRNWTDDRLCQDLATRLGEVGWVEQVGFVRRLGDGRYEVSGRYRFPFAMVQVENEFLLVDGEGVRLPGSYRYTPSWKLIQGVSGAVPRSGIRWAGADLRAGLAVIAAISGEPFASQVTGVLVGNIDGRRHALQSHVQLATDRTGGRINWGSAPGFELEENSVSQKLAILRENYRQTGRGDAGHAIIDVSVFPDRFTIPDGASG